MRNQSCFTSRHRAVSSLVREPCCEGRSPHFVVVMDANQHCNSLSKVPFKSVRPGCGEFYLRRLEILLGPCDQVVE